jgi:hypothetical protein
VDDVVIGFGDFSGLGPNRLRWLTSLAGAGKAVRLKVLRSKDAVDLSIRLEPLREGAVAPGSRDP